MVKVKLVGNYNINLIKQNELLNEYLNDKYFFAKLSDESRRYSGFPELIELADNVTIEERSDTPFFL